MITPHVIESPEEPLKRPWTRIGLRVWARILEITSDLVTRNLNYTDVTDQIAIGGAYRSDQIPLLKHRGVTCVVDCRQEAKDDVEGLKAAGIRFLHLPTPDHYALSGEQLVEGVEWVLDHLKQGGRAFMHCQHGVGRGPLMGLAVMVALGHSSRDALRIMQSTRWQASPNDRQLQALVDFERYWRKRTTAQSASSS
jgi:predicted protein tyrosine phosphatase